MSVAIIQQETPSTTRLEKAATWRRLCFCVPCFGHLENRVLVYQNKPVVFV
jgi:hypothetical protein